MYRSILYSIFEIVFVMLLFLGAGFVSLKITEYEDSVPTPPLKMDEEFSWEFCDDDTKILCPSYQSEKSEITAEKVRAIIAEPIEGAQFSYTWEASMAEREKKLLEIGYDNWKTKLSLFTGGISTDQYSEEYWHREIEKKQEEKWEIHKLMSTKMAHAINTKHTNFWPPKIYILPKNPPRGVSAGSIFPILQTFIILVVLNITRNVVHEKATFRQYLVSMGLPISTYYLAHFLFNVVKCTLIFAPGFFFFTQTQTSVIAAVYLCVSVILFLFPAITFAFMIASWFKTQKGAILTCLVLWLILVYLPYFVINNDPEKLTSYLIVIPTSLIFTFNMYYIGATIARMSELEEFSMFATSDRALPLFAFWIGLLINAAMMFGLAVLGDELAGAGIFRRKKKSNESTSGEHQLLAAQDQSLRKTLESDIDINDVVKIYPTGEKAVKGLTMRAIRGQVSVLLGHNGCGKSSTFAMIAGMSRPTEGSIQVGGLDVVSNRKEARKKIGLCPQYNPLIDKLTVWEHLKIVHTLKKAETPFEEDAAKLLEAIKLTEKKDELSKNLSGGMKRKLCMCMALIGNSCVVLLDEPTAGMDAAARLDVQAMLRASKTQRTILLTTHNMDEADKLADWVYVMSEGRIQASGSSQFLKSKFGGGWLITVVVEDAEKDAPILLDVCKKFVNGAAIKETRGQMIEFSVPSDDKNQLIEMLKCLEVISEKDFNSDVLKNVPNLEKVKNVQISSIGVSLNSLEQVFINIIEQCEKAANKNRTAEQKSATLQKVLLKKEEGPAFGPLSQFIGLSLKRMIYIRRNLILHILNFLIPIALYLLVIGLLLGEDNLGSSRSITVDVNLIPPSSIVVIQTDSEVSDIDAFFKKNPKLIIKKFGTSRDMMDILKKEQFFNRISIFVKAENQKAKEIWVHKYMMQAAPIGVYLKLKINRDDERVFKFNWILYPGETAAGYFGFLLMFGLFALFMTYNTSTCAFLHAEERVAKFKHQQFLTEMSPFIYWFAMYFWEFVIFLPPLAICLGIMLIYEIVWVWTAFQFFLISCLTWLATAPIIFIISFLIDSSTKITLLVLLFCFFIPLIKIAIDFVLATIFSVPGLQYTRFIFPFQPYITLLFGAYYKQDPNSQVLLYIIRVFFGKDVGIDRELFDLIMLGTSAVLYNLVVLLISNRSLAKAILGHSNHLAEPRKILNMEPCEGVATEEKDIKEGRLTPANCTVLVNNMVKRYGSYQAVNGVFLGVKSSECFGLVGVSGAGKSTMIEILTGKQFACSGNATISEIPVENSVKLGYCPQFDAMLPDFTGRDILKIMVRLQNYPNASELVDELIDCVGMTGNADKRIKYCSGGQKRKISMAMAILSRSAGNSGNLIILDEPTAGVDPKARRDLWDIVVGMRRSERNRTGIMLTSHSMEECEALCTRIGILRKGEMIALATHQHLKSNYGNTFTLTIIVLHEQQRDEIVNRIRATFGEKSILLTDEKDKSSSLVWELPRGKGDKWSTKMNEVKKVAEELKIADYFLVQSSLEDTFIKMNSPNIEKKQV